MSPLISIHHRGPGEHRGGVVSALRGVVLRGGGGEGWGAGGEGLKVIKHAESSAGIYYVAPLRTHSSAAARSPALDYMSKAARQADISANK